MRYAVALGTDMPIAHLRALVVAAQANGINRIWLRGGLGDDSRDALTVLAALTATRTDVPDSMDYVVETDSVFTQPCDVLRSVATATEHRRPAGLCLPVSTRSELLVTETVTALQGLITGDVVDFAGEEFDVDDRAVPYADPSTPIWVRSARPMNVPGVGIVADQPVLAKLATFCSENGLAWTTHLLTSHAILEATRPFIAGEPSEVALVGSEATCAAVLRQASDHGVEEFIVTVPHPRFAVDLIESYAEVISLV